MAYINTITLKQGKKFEEFYKTPKNVSKLSNKEIKDYLAKYGETNDNDLCDFGNPELIASTIKKPKKGLEFKSGYTGDIIYHGVVDNMFRKFSDVEALKYIGNGAYFENRKITIDTYFNKVLEEAVKRKIIKLDRKDGTIYLNDLFSLRLQRSFSFERDSVRNRQVRKQLEDFEKWRQKSEELARDDKRIWNYAIA